MRTESIFESPALIGYLVKRLVSKHPHKQVGKTLVQKMIYLLTRRGVVDFDYSMYHYGPYSAEVAGELNFAECAGIVKINWVDEKGYFIQPGPELDKFESLPPKNQREAIDTLIERFGHFNAIELSILTTALFLKDNFGVPDGRLAEVVHTVKSNHRLDFIEEKLRETGIIKN